MPAVKTPVETAAVIWKPVLIRALVAAIFGVTTIFLQEPGLNLLKFGLAAYLVFSGSAMWEYLRRDPVPERMRSPLSMAAAVWVVGAIILLFVGTPMVAAIVGGLVLVLGGAAELTTWFRFRRVFIPARDQLITGAVGVISGAGLLIWMNLDPNALLGIAGGGAIIIAVALAISGFGFRHDAGPAADADEPRAPRS